MIFHFVLNTLLVFFILTLFIEGTLYVFNIENPRVRYLARSLPVLKLPFDLLFFLFFNETPFINLNPFSCEIFAYKMVSKWVPFAIQSRLKAGEHLILPVYIARYIPVYLLNVFTFVTVAGALGLLSRKILQFYSYQNELKQILASANLFEWDFHNSKLKEDLEKNKVKVLASDRVIIPMAAANNNIVVPHTIISELTSEEVEAVIAHEFEHLRWKDPLLKMTNALIFSVCWWIPAKWWIKRIEADQEEASDSSVYRYSLHGRALASALVKIVTKAKTFPYRFSFACRLDSCQGKHVQRFEKLLQGKTEKLWTLSSFAMLATAMFYFVSFWSC